MDEYTIGDYLSKIPKEELEEIWEESE